MATVVLDVLHATDTVGNAAEAEAAAESGGPQTKDMLEHASTTTHRAHLLGTSSAHELDTSHLDLGARRALDP